MAGIYVLNIGTASAKQWVSFSYEHTLCGMSNCQIVVDGANSAYSAQFDVGSEINIYKSGALKFRGIVTSKDSLPGGGIVMTAMGIEIELADVKSPMVGSAVVRTWATTSDNTIFTTLVTSVSGWTVDVANSTSANVDFRTSASESVWNAIIRLVTDSGKDIWVDRSEEHTSEPQSL